MSGEAPSAAGDSGVSHQQIIGTAVFAAIFFMIFAGVFFGAREFSPEARLFPRLISLVAIASAAIVFVQSVGEALGTRRQLETVAPETAASGWRDIAITYAGPALYCVTMALLGFWIASAIFLAGLLIILGTRRLFVVLAITVGTLSAIYVAFDLIFGIELPEGMLLTASGS